MAVSVPTDRQKRLENSWNQAPPEKALLKVLRANLVSGLLSFQLPLFVPSTFCSFHNAKT